MIGSDMVVGGLYVLRGERKPIKYTGKNFGGAEPRYEFEKTGDLLGWIWVHESCLHIVARWSKNHEH